MPVNKRNSRQAERAERTRKRARIAEQQQTQTKKKNEGQLQCRIICQNTDRLIVVAKKRSNAKGADVYIKATRVKGCNFSGKSFLSARDCVDTLGEIPRINLEQTLKEMEETLRTDVCMHYFFLIIFYLFFFCIFSYFFFQV